MLKTCLLFFSTYLGRHRYSASRKTDAGQVLKTSLRSAWPCLKCSSCTLVFLGSRIGHAYITVALAHLQRDVIIVRNDALNLIRSIYRKQTFMQFISFLIMKIYIQIHKQTVRRVKLIGFINN